MTHRTTVLAIATVLLVPLAAWAQSPQLTAEAQLATPKLDPSAVVTDIDLKATPLGEVVGAIAKASGITVRYHSAVTNLGTLSDAKLSNTAAGDALQSVVAPKRALLNTPPPPAGHPSTRKQKPARKAKKSR